TTEAPETITSNEGTKPVSADVVETDAPGGIIFKIRQDNNTLSSATALVIITASAAAAALTVTVIIAKKKKSKWRSV
ncbi:MAG: hypothetical protein IKK94_06515, partial [Clostridia bacterium]|nr:hypothetical protein [Clostridia bacterium]